MFGKFFDVINDTLTDHVIKIHKLLGGEKVRGVFFNAI